MPLETTVKSLVLATDELNGRGEIAKSHIWLLLLRGDHDMNEIKASKVPGLDNGFRFATVPEIISITGHTPQSATRILRHYLAQHPEMADSAIRKMVTMKNA